MSQSNIPTKSELLDREPPHDREAELRCIGSVLRSDKAYHAMRLTPEDFYVPLHAAAWRIFAGLDDKRLPLDDSTAIRAECSIQGMSVASLTEVLLEAKGELGFTVHPNYYADIPPRPQATPSDSAGTLPNFTSFLTTNTPPSMRFFPSANRRWQLVKFERWTTDPIPLETALIAVQDKIDAMLSSGEHLGSTERSSRRSITKWADSFPAK